MNEAAYSTPRYVPGLSVAVRNIARSTEPDVRNLNMRMKALSQLVNFSSHREYVSAIFTTPGALEAISHTMRYCIS